MRRRSLIVAAAALVFALVAAFLTLTGLYVEPPVPKKSPGATLWFYRRLVKTPFLFSSDSIALANGTTPNREVRSAVNANVEARLSRYVLARFAFSKALYMATTGNRDFLGKEEPDAAAEAPAGDPPRNPPGGE